MRGIMRILVNIFIIFIFIGCATQREEKFIHIDRVCPKGVGEFVPEVKLKNINGKKIMFTSVYTKKKTVLVFYRGGWCPHCNKQLNKLRKVYSQIKKLGFQLIAISPDKPSKLRMTLKDHKLPYILLSDSKAVMTSLFGLSYRVKDSTNNFLKSKGIDIQNSSGEKHQMLPHPSVYVIDRTGKIHFSYVNPDYKTRLDEKVLISVLKGMK